MGFSKQAIENLLCSVRKPSAEQWQVYYLKQARPEMTIEQISRMLNMSRRKVSDTLRMFKIHQGEPIRYGWDNLERIFEFMEGESELELDKNFLLLTEAINYCPHWPDWKDGRIREFFMEIDDSFLSPEMQILKYTMAFMDDALDHEFLLERFLEFRFLFNERGLKLLYWMATVPYAALAMLWNARFSEEDYIGLRENSQYLPYFYRQIYREIQPMVKFMSRDIFQIPFTSILDENGGKVDAFFRYILTGKYDKALQLDFSDEVMPDSLRRVISIMSLNLRIILSKEPPEDLPPFPTEDFEYAGLFSHLNYYLIRLLIARLRGENPEAVIEDAPEEIYYTIKRIYIDHDRNFFKGVGWYGEKLITMMVNGEVNRAWEIARNQKLMYDFHINYILLGFPLLDLLAKYKLRIGWYPIKVSFTGKHAYIHYAGGKFRIPPTPSFLLKEVIQGKGYMGRKDYKNFNKHLWFLRIKKQKFGERILITLDEDVEVIEE